ncbi:Helix-turn-helix domain-containing protein [Lentzea waywayandensis]|uniref:Helix-turn-helix domain-containing protein n=2 Tax=Lentzea waywayandensis TaxID=84724 RepID=A0A1I6FCV1_9PSEU|nr:Helix-turn-helix domain-containing protein [Lentzea waywayandensis]
MTPLVKGSITSISPCEVEGLGLMLVELSVVEQRYHAVMEVLAGVPVTEVAGRYRVSRQSVHTWVTRYRSGGLAGLADRSHRPKTCPHQVESEIEALICEFRRPHPSWGPRRLVHELEHDAQLLIAHASGNHCPSPSSIRVVVTPFPARKYQIGIGEIRNVESSGQSTIWTWLVPSLPAGPPVRY